MNGKTDRTTADWLKLIDEQIELSDYGNNTYDLNTLYYEFYVHMCHECDEYREGEE